MNIHKMINPVHVIIHSYIMMWARYRVFIKYCVFSFKFCDFLNSASSAAALVFYLPGVCTHTDIERKQSPENLRKNTIFNEHPVCIYVYRENIMKLPMISQK